MRTPTWLTEMYRQWQKSRGRRLDVASRPFSRSWPELLDDSEIFSGEDIKTAKRELEALEKQGLLKVKRHRYRRYLIEKVILPLENEDWLVSRFGGIPAAVLLEESRLVLEEFRRKVHPIYPGEWRSLLERLLALFSSGRSSHPFKWSEPEVFRKILEISWELTGREWESGTLIRSASVAMGLDSKELERRKANIEAALTELFGEESGMRSMGLAEGDTHVELSGCFQLNFPDGSCQRIDQLRIARIDTSDIYRCESITTDAEELLTIENKKTTFRQYAEANSDGGRLIATTSFPTPTFREFLKKLPEGIRHSHFGDTDPAGWHILLKLREVGPRVVDAYRMKWRPGKEQVPLTAYDARILPKLLASPLLEDVRGEIRLIEELGDKGDFEQESLGG